MSTPCKAPSLAADVVNLSTPKPMPKSNPRTPKLKSSSKKIVPEKLKIKSKENVIDEYEEFEEDVIRTPRLKFKDKNKTTFSIYEDGQPKSEDSGATIFSERKQPRVAPVSSTDPQFRSLRKTRATDAQTRKVAEVAGRRATRREIMLDDTVSTPAPARATRSAAAKKKEL